MKMQCDDKNMKVFLFDAPSGARSEQQKDKP